MQDNDHNVFHISIYEPRIEGDSNLITINCFKTGTLPQDPSRIVVKHFRELIKALEIDVPLCEEMLRTQNVRIIILMFVNVYNKITYITGKLHNHRHIQQ